MPYKNISKGVTAVAEYETFGETDSIHFAEWWNGEGWDFTLESKSNGKQVIPLHASDMEQLCAMMLATRQIDLGEVQAIVEEYDVA